MTLTLTKIDHGNLCHGWAWEVTDQSVLADQVARIALGQYRHVAKILAGAGVPGPSTSADQATAAINHLKLADDADPWDRDGWLFQAISWIAAHQAPSASLTRAPHIRKSDKGFDGMQLELSGDGATIEAVVVFEDKATVHSRKVLKEEVWPGIVALEQGKRLNELTQEVSAMLDAQAAANPDFDVDSAIAKTLWHDARRYRVSITIDDKYNTDKKRARLFKGFDSSAPGLAARRRADTIHLPKMREWMDGFADLVVARIKVIANV